MNTPLALETADLHGGAAELRGLSHETVEAIAELEGAWGHMRDMLAQMAAALDNTAHIMQAADDEAATYFVWDGDATLTDANGNPIYPLLPETGAPDAPTAGPLEDIRDFLCRVFGGIFCPPSSTPTPPPVTIYPTPTGTPTLPSTGTPPPPTTTPTTPTLSYPLPPQVTLHNQYDPTIKDPLGANACGLVSVAAAAEALGLSYSEVMEWFKANAQKYGYTSQHGIQPSDYLRLVQAMAAAKGLPLSASSTSGASDKAAIERMRTELLKGNHVVVDILATAPSTRTTPSDSTDPGRVAHTFAHFARVVGFSADGNTIYLAESLDAGSPTVAVNTEVLLRSMKNPEGRAFDNSANRENLDNWMMIIAPSQSQ